MSGRGLVVAAVALAAVTLVALPLFDSPVASVGWFDLLGLTADGVTRGSVRGLWLLLAPWLVLLPAAVLLLAGRRPSFRTVVWGPVTAAGAVLCLVAHLGVVGLLYYFGGPVLIQGTENDGPPGPAIGLWTLALSLALLAAGGVRLRRAEEAPQG